jgi:transcriptional regulator with XRE-family HTH domain
MEGHIDPEDLIRSARVARGMLRAHVARAAKCSDVAFGRIEDGIKDPSPDLAMRIAAAVKMDPRVLREAYGRRERERVLARVESRWGVA